MEFSASPGGWALFYINFQRSKPVRFSRVLENFGQGSVFGEGSYVSDSVMSSAAVQLAAQAHRENAAVAEGLKRHDPELLDTLIVRYQHRLLRYLLYLTGNREQAEDLFQETWMRVLLRGDQFNGDSRFDTWLFTIARNLVIDMRRKRSMASLEELCEAGTDDRPMEIPSNDRSPLEQFEQLEKGCLLGEVLLTLDPLHREVIVLRFQEELSLEEISQVTRAPLSTVKSRLYRGLTTLKPRVTARTSSARGAVR